MAPYHSQGKVQPPEEGVCGSLPSHPQRPPTSSLILPTKAPDPASLKCLASLLPRDLSHLGARPGGQSPFHPPTPGRADNGILFVSVSWGPLVIV